MAPPEADSLYSLYSDICELAVLNITLAHYRALFWMALHCLLHSPGSDQARENIWLSLVCC